MGEMILILIERQRTDCSDANISMIRLRVASPHQTECSPISCIRLKGQMSSSQQTTSKSRENRAKEKYKSSDAPEGLGLLLSPGLVAELGLHHYYK